MIESLKRKYFNGTGYVIIDMWMLTRDLIKKKWRQRSKAYLMEFERSGEKAIYFLPSEKY